MGRKVKVATSLKDNFWSRKRVEAGLHVKDVANLLNMASSSVGEYLTGQVIPPEPVIKALCLLFDVDYDTGELEFQRAHRAWKSMREHKDYKVISAKTLRAEALASEVKEEPAMTKFTEELYSVIYGKVTFEQYEEIRKGQFDGVRILSYIYGKVDYATYIELEELLGV